MPRKYRKRQYCTGSASFIEIFWSRVDVKGPDECWRWNHRLGNHGYAEVDFAGRDYRDLAHRVAYQLSTQTEIPDGLTIDHTCRNKPCCNPSHHEVVTLEVNGSRARVGMHEYWNGQPLCRAKRHPKAGPGLCRQCTAERNERYNRKRGVAV